MKLTVILYGINRCRSLSLRSLESALLSSLPSDYEIDVLDGIIDNSSIVNSRSSEFISVMDPINSLHTAYPVRQVVVPSLSLSQLSSLYKFDISSLKDPFFDGHASTRNLFNQLNLLNLLSNHLSPLSDFYILARNDILYQECDSTAIKFILSQAVLNKVVLPFSQWNNGVNDRVLICSGSLILYILRRIRLVPLFTHSKGYLNSEELLLYALHFLNISFCVTSLYTHRFRANALVARENLLPFSSNILRSLSCCYSLLKSSTTQSFHSS